MLRCTLPAGVALAAALAACATLRETPAGRGDLVVHVENNIAPPTAVWVLLVAHNGAERELGGTPPTSTKLWRLREPIVAGRYRLVARRHDSATVVSRPFDLRPSEVVHWDISLNDVRTEGWRGEDELLRELLQPAPPQVATSRVARASTATAAPPGR